MPVTMQDHWWKQYCLHNNLVNHCLPFTTILSYMFYDSVCTYKSFCYKERSSPSLTHYRSLHQSPLPQGHPRPSRWGRHSYLAPALGPVAHPEEWLCRRTVAGLPSGSAPVSDDASREGSAGGQLCQGHESAPTIMRGERQYIIIN